MGFEQWTGIFILFAMLTLISSTNRPNSRTEKVSRYIVQRLKSLTDEAVHFFDLAHLPYSILHADMYDKNGQSREIQTLQDRYFKTADRFIFVIPEYNGGVPGILKLWIDAMSVRKYDETFRNKKACLIGISSGRAGNLRGLEHFTGILNYLNIVVFPDKLPISSIQHVLKDDKVLDEETTEAVDDLLKRFLEF